MTDAFAAKAAEWDKHPARAAMGQDFHAQVALAALAHFDGSLAGRTLLDFGCGTGTLGLRLALEHALRPVFVDSSPAMLNILRGKLAELHLPEAVVHEGRLDTLPLHAESVDLAVSLMALHHVEDAHGALRTLRGLLRPGGLLLLGDLLPEDGSFHADMRADMKAGAEGDTEDDTKDGTKDGGDGACHNGFDPEELRRACQDMGYAVQRLLPFHMLRKPDGAGLPREYPLFFLAARAV
ncbi:MAG: methyltransferase domain-containing protein [Desulfovibrio sp.]|jgi:ubiquinone/menaquinone biosynthesis C-methylase UbiE|nr:methyltransferase domain-containing protein [Desulfovibrio sp.]